MIKHLDSKPRVNIEHDIIMKINEIIDKLNLLEGKTNQRQKDIDRVLQQSDPRFNNWHDPHSM